MVSLTKVEVILGNSEFERGNRGLHELLILIGANEIQKKKVAAQQNGKEFFFIKTGKKSKRRKCSVSGNSHLTRNNFYRMGLDYLNRSMKRGQRNKQSIKNLVLHNRVKFISEDDGSKSEHYVYSIPRFVAPVFFNCLYRYIYSEFYEPNVILQSVYWDLDPYFSGMQEKGSVIVGNPYLTQIRMMPCFIKQKEILSAIDRFDNLL